jgi:hypothetical protein
MIFGLFRTVLRLLKDKVNHLQILCSIWIQFQS